MNRFLLSTSTQVVGILLLGICASPAMADDATSDVIVVTANRAPAPIASVGQSVAVIDTTELITFQRVTVVDALRLVPGVTVARNGGIGTATSVNIRGADSDQTVALIDGVKINDPSSPGGGFNFGPLLVGNISRIEVVRGSQSVLWSCLAGLQAPDAGRALLDGEPLASLDPAHQLDVLDRLRAVAARATGVVLVVHDLTHAACIADHAPPLIPVRPPGDPAGA